MEGSAEPVLSAYVQVGDSFGISDRVRDGAWHSAVRDAAVPLLAAAQDADKVRPGLGVMEMMALTTAVARAGNPAQAGYFPDILLEGIVPQ